MRAKRNACISITLICTTTCIWAAEPSELTTLRVQHNKAIEQVQQEAQTKEKRINEQYHHSLDFLMQSLTRSGKLDAALAVRDEMNQVAKTLGMTNTTVVSKIGGLQEVSKTVEAERKIVSLMKPYPSSYKDAPTDRMQVQYAIIELGMQVGLQYDFNQSAKNTDNVCRQYVTPKIKSISFQAAMREILNPLGLTYDLRDGTTIVLKKK